VNLIVWLLARKWRLSTLVSNKIFINNPFFAVAPIEMSLSNFEAGWEEKRRLYAVIGLTPP